MNTAQIVRRRYRTDASLESPHLAARSAVNRTAIGSYFIRLVPMIQLGCSALSDEVCCLLDTSLRLSAMNVPHLTTIPPRVTVGTSFAPGPLHLDIPSRAR